MRALIKLSRSSGLYPQCLVRNDIQLLGTDAVAAGRFGDVWKATNSKNELIAVKTLRMYEKSDIEKLLKVILSNLFVTVHSANKVIVGIFLRNSDVASTFSSKCIGISWCLAS